MTSPCLDCTLKEINEKESGMHNEIPLWYKKSGNYSLLPKALNCNDKFNPNENELVEDPPKITSNELHIPINIKI